MAAYSHIWLHIAIICVIIALHFTKEAIYEKS